MQWIGGKTARDNAALVALATAQLEERMALQEKRRQMVDEVGHKDLMHYLLTNADPKTGIQLTRTELEGDSLSLIGAGADTVATIMSAILFYLVRNSTALRTVTSEARSAFQSLEEIRSGARLDSCVYLNACIEETLRLSPVVPAQLPREVMDGGITIDGQFVPEGTVVGVSAYVVHHNEEAFPEPWSFRPERWIPVGGVSREDVSLAREAMCPFSLGKRGCIGKKLAYIEMRIAIASLLWCYDLEEAKGIGRNGGGHPDLEQGRRRRDEFQLFDCFGSDREGPVLRFRQRS
jgi:cytochrome P450